jgi:UDP-N-acetylglucosamine:LPS N-acetylglucosamine transferase
MNTKVCFAASLGGHLEEISRLINVNRSEDSFLLTEKGNFHELSVCNKVYYIKQINRKEILFLPKLLVITVESFGILAKEKPDCIISTGALATYPICLLGRIMGKKIIYIESFARVDSPSLTGKLMYKIADLFIVQWEEMLNIFPKAKFVGGIF